MILIACKMLEPEIRSVLQELQLTLPVCWLERGLHNDPEQLHTVLQDYLDTLSTEDTVLLSFSACGGASVGLQCRSDCMVLPRYDDCIRSVLADEHGCPMPADPYTLYYTRGWLDCRHSLPSELAACADRFGPVRTERLRRALVGNYRSLCAVDTGLGDFDDWQPLARQSADLLKLSYSSCTGSMQTYRKLLSGNWDSSFIVKKRGEILQLSDFHPDLIPVGKRV